ncbi:c-type cytochrome [Roseicyclus mahoneyensis]|uniref:Mono/diheme cytochrome c family protein n=1 Tax=Roseicyclus mahoneyensis TaxID=164332 RepID=A0A316GHU4_9RHOB|nr:cytochrome c [Roseicyclus mahoneyensis]PWK60161.1 mono/diheme cytochrome c family protein [Roseicyclus mahoneyensis]
MKRKTAMIGGVGVLVLTGAAVALWPAGATEAPGQILRWQDAAVVAEGAGIYAAYCAACHGLDLEGQPDWQVRLPNGRLPAPPHDASGHTWHHPDAQLIDLTTRGTAAVVGGGYESDMMGFGDVLTEEEIIAVLSYIKSTWPPEVIVIHDEITAQSVLR